MYLIQSLEKSDHVHIHQSIADIASDRVSQFWHSWHYGLENSLLFCPVHPRMFSKILVSTQWMPVAPPVQIRQPKMAPVCYQMSLLWGGE